MNVPIVWVVVPDVTLEEVEECSIGRLHLAVALGVSGVVRVLWTPSKVQK